MFNEYEKELDESNQKTKNYGNYIGDDENKKDVINNFFRILKYNLKMMIFTKKKSYRRFIKLLNNNKRELQSQGIEVFLILS